MKRTLSIALLSALFAYSSTGANIIPSPIKIAFVIYQLSFRGMELATYDYAHYNETLLGNRSYVINFDAHTDNQVRTKFSSRFENRFLDCETVDEMQYLLQEHKIDILYALKHGYDGLLSNSCPTAVHIVFPGNLKPHGDLFATISPWMARQFPQHKLRYVPHIVQVDETKENLRSELGIPKEALVFGRYGGIDSFNVPCALEAVKEVTHARPDIYFIFLNTRAFCDLPNVKYVPKTTDLEYKTKFINSCDALLHARWRGETFGLTCAEFALKNKPIITWQHSQERAHVDFLGNTGIYYGNKEELVDILLNFKKEPYKNWNAYGDTFTPEKVMTQFNNIFIEPLRNKLYAYKKRELQPFQVAKHGEENPELMMHLQELFGTSPLIPPCPAKPCAKPGSGFEQSEKLYRGNSKQKKLYWLDCQEAYNNRKLYEPQQRPILHELGTITQLSNSPTQVIIIDHINLLEQEIREWPTLDNIYQFFTQRAFSVAIMGDTLLAYKSNNIRLSPLVNAMTTSRLSDCETCARALTIDKLMAAEKWIGKASDEQASIWQTLNCPGKRFASRHYRLWQALWNYHHGKYTQAADGFQQLLNEGYVHWRVYWYLARTLHKLSDPRTEMVMEQVARMVPNFYGLAIWRNKISQ